MDDVTKALNLVPMVVEQTSRGACLRHIFAFIKGTSHFSGWPY